jgi:hypothetical protein
MRVRLQFFIFSALLGSAVSHAQVLVTGAGPRGTLRLFPTDMAVLEAGEPRTDLPCSVQNSKAILGFDLRFHAGYEVTVPLRDLAGSENTLTVLFRITPVEPPGEPIFMTHRIRVPEIAPDAKGEASVYGAFDIGEGNYQIAWLMRDRSERVCAQYWDIAAELPVKDKEIELAMNPGEIRPIDREQFKEEPPVARAANESPLNVKVLVNFAPQDSQAAALLPSDTSALVSILRNISREPRIGRFSIVAFNLQEQRVLYRQENADRIDFPALGEALDSLQLGTVNLTQLAQKNADTSFLTALIQNEVAGARDAADAVVIAGPKALLNENIPDESLQRMAGATHPVFYMNYNSSPHAVPWNDTISKAVKTLKGYEYTITRPRDVWYAVTEMVSKIVKSKQEKRSGTSSSE